ncbi:RNA polymerase II mediator complex subunit [Hanseniaspora osmophila]
MSQTNGAINNHEENANTLNNANVHEQGLKQIQEQLQLSETNLREIIEGFIELGVSVYDYPGSEESQQGMLTGLKRHVEKIKSLNVSVDEPQNALHKVNIPLDVLQYIEDGRNPDVYTREFVEAIQLANNYQREKQKAMKLLRDSLADQIKNEFPDLEQEVQGIVNKTGGV